MTDKSNLVQQDQTPAYHENPPVQGPYNTQAPSAYQAIHYPPQPYPQQYAGAPYHPATNVMTVTAPQPAHRVEHVDDNMVISIVSLFFCFILGIFAILKSQEARDHKARGCYDMARVAARTAKQIAIIGIVIGCIGIVMAFFFLFVLPSLIYASVSNDISNNFSDDSY
ncbi:interferon-induced transmembrane protein [Elysia marginata]|uniref:Interferon-induced transmembrane protein n=1 Tax=Elysia marginata TaxID=1093978 RepID=A0AAV4JFQ1_9GAST|nr:interferon-induced transmembrane protein [Elysia marginata]